MDDLNLDEKFLRRTFDLARMARNRGNGAFGAALIALLRWFDANTIKTNHNEDNRPCCPPCAGSRGINREP